MKVRSAATALLLLAGTVTSVDLLACGDKFLVMGRGTRFQRAVPRKPAAILVYASPTSNLSRAIAGMPIEAALRKAGHRPTSVASEAELDKALRMGGWDLLLVDAAESGTVRTRLQIGSAPVVLPVISNATRKKRAFLDSIDEALSLRPALQAKPAGKTTI